MTPSRCPVCEGRGTVPAGFYTAGATDAETCRTCGGSGMVVVEAATDRRPGPGDDDPRDLTYRG